MQNHPEPNPPKADPILDAAHGGLRAQYDAVKASIGLNTLPGKQQIAAKIALAGCCDLPLRAIDFLTKYDAQVRNGAGERALVNASSDFVCDTLAGYVISRISGPVGVATTVAPLVSLVTDPITRPVRNAANNMADRIDRYANELTDQEKAALGDTLEEGAGTYRMIAAAFNIPNTLISIKQELANSIRQGFSGFIGTAQTPTWTEADKHKFAQQFFQQSGNAFKEILQKTTLQELEATSSYGRDFVVSAINNTLKKTWSFPGYNLKDTAAAPPKSHATQNTSTLPKRTPKEKLDSEKSYTEREIDRNFLELLKRKSEEAIAKAKPVTDDQHEGIDLEELPKQVSKQVAKLGNFFEEWGEAGMFAAQFALHVGGHRRTWQNIGRAAEGVMQIGKNLPGAISGITSLASGGLAAFSPVMFTNIAGVFMGGIAILQAILSDGEDDDNGLGEALRGISQQVSEMHEAMDKYFKHTFKLLEQVYVGITKQFDQVKELIYVVNRHLDLQILHVNTNVHAMSARLDNKQQAIISYLDHIVDKDMLSSVKILEHIGLGMHERQEPRVALATAATELELWLNKASTIQGRSGYRGIDKNNLAEYQDVVAQLQTWLCPKNTVLDDQAALAEPFGLAACLVRPLIPEIKDLPFFDNLIDPRQGEWTSVAKLYAKLLYENRDIITGTGASPESSEILHSYQEDINHVQTKIQNVLGFLYTVPAMDLLWQRLVDAQIEAITQMYTRLQELIETQRQELNKSVGLDSSRVLLQLNKNIDDTISDFVARREHEVVFESLKTLPFTPMSLEEYCARVASASPDENSSRRDHFSALFTYKNATYSTSIPLYTLSNEQQKLIVERSNEQDLQQLTNPVFLLGHLYGISKIIARYAAIVGNGMRFRVGPLPGGDFSNVGKNSNSTLELFYSFNWNGGLLDTYSLLLCSPNGASLAECLYKPKGSAYTLMYYDDTPIYSLLLKGCIWSQNCYHMREPYLHRPEADSIPIDEVKERLEKLVQEARRTALATFEIEFEKLYEQYRFTRWRFFALLKLFYPINDRLHEWREQEEIHKALLLEQIKAARFSGQLPHYQALCNRLNPTENLKQIALDLTLLLQAPPTHSSITVFEELSTVSTPILDQKEFRHQLLQHLNNWRYQNALPEKTRQLFVELHRAQNELIETSLALSFGEPTAVPIANHWNFMCEQIYAARQLQQQTTNMLSDALQRCDCIQHYAQPFPDADLAGYWQSYAQLQDANDHILASLKKLEHAAQEQGLTAPAPLKIKASINFVARKTPSADSAARAMSAPDATDTPQSKLHRAAQCGDFVAVQQCLEEGADTQAKNHEDKTPLDVAPADAYAVRALLITFAKWQEVITQLNMQSPEKFIAVLKKVIAELNKRLHAKDKENFKNSITIWLFGDTGAGKSTLFNLLLGSGYSEDGDDGDKLQLTTTESAPERSKTSHDPNPCTQYPEFAPYVTDGITQCWYIDTQGFVAKDNQNDNENILASALSNWLLAKATTHVQCLIWVCELREITSTRAQMAKQSLSYLIKMLNLPAADMRSTENIQKCQRMVAQLRIVITKPKGAPNWKKWESNAIIKKIKEWGIENKTLAQVTELLHADQVIVFDASDPDIATKIHKIIDGVPPIPTTEFDFLHGAQYHQELKNLLPALSRFADKIKSKHDAVLSATYNYISTQLGKQIAELQKSLQNLATAAARAEKIKEEKSQADQILRDTYQDMQEYHKQLLTLSQTINLGLAQQHRASNQGKAYPEEEIAQCLVPYHANKKFFEEFAEFLPQISQAVPQAENLGKNGIFKVKPRLSKTNALTISHVPQISAPSKDSKAHEYYYLDYLLSLQAAESTSIDPVLLQKYISDYLEKNVGHSQQTNQSSNNPNEITITLHTNGQTIRFQKCPTRGDGWCLFHAADIANPETCIDALITASQDEQNVELRDELAEIIHSNYISSLEIAGSDKTKRRIALETFGLDHAHTETLRQLQKVRDDTSDHDSAGIAATLQAIITFLSQPAVIASYLSKMKESRYASLPLLKAYLKYVAGDNIAIGIIMEHGPNRYAQDIPVTRDDQEIRYILFQPGQTQAGAHYSRLAPDAAPATTNTTHMSHST